MRAYCAPACNILSHHRLLSLWTRLLPIWNACHRQQAALQRGYQIQNLYVHCIIRAPSISLWHELSVVFCGCFPPKGCTVQLFKQLIRECTHAHTRPSAHTQKAYHLAFGPLCPSQYRLAAGHGTSDEAAALARSVVTKSKL